MRPKAQAPLADRFGVPPFTVLDARQGEWQERKRQWLAMGIQSELGRAAGATSNAFAVGDIGKYSRSLAVPGGAPFPADTIGPDGKFARGDHHMGMAEAGTVATGGATSIFDPMLCELAYRWFCPKGGAVLDPFAGGSVRGVVAGLMGMAYTGCELSAPQVAANEAQREAISRCTAASAGPRWRRARRPACGSAASRCRW